MMAVHRFAALTCLIILCSGTLASLVQVGRDERAIDPQQIIDLLPPKVKPGDTITKIDFESVDNALSDVLRAGGILQGRRCAIGVSNLGTTELSSPKWYLDSGIIYSSAPYNIQPRTTGLTLFHKRDIFIWGTTGLLTYDISETDYKVAILWQVPWNTVVYNVLSNVKIYHKNVPTDKSLFNQMKNYAGTQGSTGWMEREEYGIKVISTITDNVYAKYYVSVDASGYSPAAGPDLHTGCDRNLASPTWIGNYCWQECIPTGYCWINKKCDTVADCQAPMSCHASCKKE